MPLTDQQKIDELHRFWMVPQGPKRPSRAEEIDQLLAGVRAGRFSVRAILWLAGAALSIGAALKMFGGGGQ
jgi:hypothetical protein